MCGGGGGGVGFAEVWGGVWHSVTLTVSVRIMLCADDLVIMATSREQGRAKDKVGEVNSEFVGLNINQITKNSHTTCA